MADLDRTIVVFDTETANLHGPPHLLELGAVRVEHGEVTDHFSSLVLPEVPIEPETAEYHGITEDMVRQAPSASEVVYRFIEWAGGEWLAAHDAPQDASVLAFEAVRHGIELPEQPVLDTLALSKRLIPESPDHKLATLVAHLGLEGDEMHRALADAVYCWQVLEECIERHTDGPATGPALLALTRRVTTIAASGPVIPHVPRRLRPLEVAARDRERIVLHYGEKGEHPSPLPVYPRILFRMGQRGYLEGECANAGILKTYRLDRIQRVTPDE